MSNSKDAQIPNLPSRGIPELVAELVAWGKVATDEAVGDLLYEACENDVDFISLVTKVARHSSTMPRRPVRGIGAQRLKEELRAVLQTRNVVDLADVVDAGLARLGTWRMRAIAKRMLALKRKALQEARGEREEGSEGQ